MSTHASSELRTTARIVDAVTTAVVALLEQEIGRLRAETTEAIAALERRVDIVHKDALRALTSEIARRSTP